MSSSSIHADDGEFYLDSVHLRIFASVELTDEEGEALANEVAEQLDVSMSAVKVSIEDKFPNVRVGYSD